VLDKLLYKRYWIVLYTVHVIAFSLRGLFFSGHGVKADQKWISVLWP